MFSLFVALTIALSSNAQTAKNGKIADDQLKRWSHLDLVKDSIPGMSVDKAYAEFLKGKKSIKVIVGIVDSGVDIEHEDLKPVIWTNKNEIEGNGIDDDNNGYVDDIHGWNFLGDITKENYEYDRIENNIHLTDEVTYKKAKAESDKKLDDANQGKVQMEKALEGTTKADDVLAKFLGKAVYTADEVNGITSDDEEISKSKSIMQRMLSYGLSVVDLKKEIQKQLDQANELLDSGGVLKDYRKVLGDNPDDLDDTKYGDNNVMGPDKEEILHGTHVAGIIAQTRDNKLGGDGIASEIVEILTVRAVPDGDEYDKDIALGIRYAVDNGAKVINGSFGKSYSPHKQWVYDCLLYTSPSPRDRQKSRMPSSA